MPATIQVIHTRSDQTAGWHMSATLSASMSATLSASMSATMWIHLAHILCVASEQCGSSVDSVCVLCRHQVSYHISHHVDSVLALAVDRAC